MLLAAVLGACTSVPTATLEDPRTASNQPPRIVPAPDTAPADPRGCDEADRAALVAVVDGQLAAIADGDWSGALGFATDRFRDGIDEERFRQIITGGFPVVADNRARDVGPCRASSGAATLEVTVEDRDGTQQVLLYLFEREADGWGIDGAAPASPGPTAPDEPALTA